jgi:hypothetical protein
MKLHRRLEALEKRLINEPTILTMPDGTTATISGDVDYLRQLLGSIFGDRLISSGQTKHLDLIRRSTESREPDGAHLIDLIRALLNSPADGSEQLTEFSRPVQ